jgi:3,4-dihydroxy 2-butanone 4-phosphate synthase/GTP cyclohydrolase II
MEAAQELIQKAGRGVIIWLDQEGKGNGHLALIESIPYKKEFGQAEAYVRAGYKADARSYSAAAQILDDLRVRSIVLLANSPEKGDELEKDSVVVSEIKSLSF